MQNTSSYMILTVHKTSGEKDEHKLTIEEAFHMIVTWRPYFSLNGIEKIVVDSVEPFEGRRRYKTFYADKTV